MLRQPLRTLFTTTVTQTISGVNTFNIPFQDIDGLVAKATVATNSSGGADQIFIWLQTTDDAGTTWYDCVAFGTISSTVANGAALFARVPVQGSQGQYQGQITASSKAVYVGNVSGVPILSNQLRLAWAYGTMDGTGLVRWTFSLLANDQSPHA